MRPTRTTLQPWAERRIPVLVGNRLLRGADLINDNVYLIVIVPPSGRNLRKALSRAHDLLMERIGRSAEARRALIHQFDKSVDIASIVSTERAELASREAEARPPFVEP